MKAATLSLVLIGASSAPAHAFLQPNFGRARASKLVTGRIAAAQGSTTEVEDPVDEKLAAALAQDILTQPPADPTSVFVLPDADAVGQSVFDCVDEAAEAAIAEKGHFVLGIPGGSILKMLAGTAPRWYRPAPTACTANPRTRPRTHPSTYLPAK